MKKLICIFLLIFLSVASPATNIADVVSGQELTLDGTSQQVTFLQTTKFKILMQKQGFVTLFFYVDATNGARIGNETINNSVHKLYAQDARVIITTVFGDDVYIKGTNGEKITVSF